MPSPDTTDSTRPSARLNGTLGVTGIVFMVIAAAAPLTVIAGNVPIAIGLGPGAGAPVGFLIAAAVLLVFSVGFVAMTPFVAEAGAFFSYVTAGLGPRPGLGSAYTALVAYTAIQVGIYGYFGWAADNLMRYYGGPELPWWLWAAGLILVVGALGYRQIDLSAKVLGVALVLEIAVVVVLDVVVVARGGAEGISASSFSPSAITSGPLGIAVLFALTGFIGFEATAVFRDEARDPARTIPRATYAAVTIIGVFYAISAWAVVEAWGPSKVRDVANASLASGDSMLLTTVRDYLGPILHDVTQVLLVTSLFACALSFHNIIARYQFVLAGKTVFPAPLARVHGRHGSPHLSSGVQTVTAAACVAAFAVSGVSPLVGVFGSMAGVSTVGMILLLLLTSIAVPAYFFRHPHDRAGRVLQTYVLPVIAVVALLACLVIVLDNFTLVTGQSAGVSAVLAAVPVVAFVIGFATRSSRRLAVDSAREN
ncbi:APC family permease [Tsukamurella strandjordii]|uniref:APC family permease n=1 Tax=Tsukamurella strandjordii TaxID=147577 RepID=A0AA90N6T3_9ACTN|nr:APC family permease [Tsukamurella strandjordii]MDP0396632.1 APC family permease [Tsukamurella strandjordii]